MNDYQTEQLEALQLARGLLSRIAPAERERLENEIKSYRRFRQRVDDFLRLHFGRQCNQSCYENRLSACCSKDGIVTFWADVVVNALCSSDDELSNLVTALIDPLYTYKCTYLGRGGCRWRLRPLMCAMFLCDQVQAEVFNANNGEVQRQWKLLNEQAGHFRWPDQPVLFDRLETYFLDLGYRSPLMYINTSPGLMRIKHKAGLS